MRAVDLFCGIGGFRLALKQVIPSAEVVFSCDIDEHCRRVYEANFGEVPRGDIRSIKSDEVPNHDLLMAGFPCPSFSIAGISKMKSLGQCIAFEREENGKLFFEIARILEEKKPPVVLLENVKNLKSVKKGLVFRVIKDTLAKIGYDVHWSVLDARRFGLPQRRERIFIVGFLEEFDFSFPKGDPTLSPKVRNILEEKVPEMYTLSDHTWERLLQRKKGYEVKEQGFGYQMVDLNDSAFTLMAHYARDPHTNLVPQEGNNPRRFTPRECARLQGFPDEFKIDDTITQAYRQLGNAVPVPVARAVIESVADAMDKKKKRVTIAKFFK